MLQTAPARLSISSMPNLPLNQTELLHDSELASQSPFLHGGVLLYMRSFQGQRPEASTCFQAASWSVGAAGLAAVLPACR